MDFGNDQWMLNYLRYSVLTWSTIPALLLARLGITRPGQSQSVTSSVSSRVWKCLVLPGVSDTRTFYTEKRELRVINRDQSGVYLARQQFIDG